MRLSEASTEVHHNDDGNDRIHVTRIWKHGPLWFRASVFTVPDFGGVDVASSVHLTHKGAVKAHDQQSLEFRNLWAQ